VSGRCCSFFKCADNMETYKEHKKSRKSETIQGKHKSLETDHKEMEIYCLENNSTELSQRRSVSNERT
jgi:hypothetical protein